MGVIKDIKTSIIGKTLGTVHPKLSSNIYDRELLFGQLSYGEMIIINENVNSKYNSGYASAFIRSSLAPTVIGMDILDTQKEYLKDMARLALTLTPENSRGVPLWIDIIDKEVKISDAMMRGIIERYIDREIYEKFFISERDKRTN